jgi:hypothetical protein
MLSNSELYGMWRRRLAQLAPDKLPIRAKKLSLDKRRRRFLDNGAIRVREWYRPVAEGLIRAASSAGQVNLVIDCSKVGFGHQLLMVGIAYRRRVLPLVWTWVRHRKGHSTTRKQIALLAYVRTLIPEGVKVSLVGDCEFGNTLLIEYLDFWKWDYALRQPGDHLVMLYGKKAWQRLDSLGATPGTLMWLGRVVLTRASAYPTHVVVCWALGEKEPWYLATNLPSPHGAIRLYRRRPWIEEMFGDMKGHGFDLEATYLRHFLRLSRLTLAVSLLYLWLTATGEHVLATGLAHEVDRTDRRDLSIFRIGWDFIERCLALQDPIPISFVPNFCSVSGG